MCKEPHDTFHICISINFFFKKDALFSLHFSVSTLCSSSKISANHISSVAFSVLLNLDWKMTHPEVHGCV